MNLTKRLKTLLIATMFAIFTLATCTLCYLKVAPASAEARQDYYYSQLNAEGKRFYDAIADMDEQGLLKQGNAKYDLIANNVMTNAQLESFSKNQKVLETFGAARDAYYLDYPEVFYVDFSYLSISVGKKDGNFVATLGTGRADSYYIPNGFTAKDQVEAAITAYNAALKEITDAAATFSTDAEKVKSVNQSLVEKITYSFCTEAPEAAYAPHIRNAYGAIVNGKAVCEGFARSFKCAMDSLGIPCVIVQGYISDNGGMEPHAWNYVKLEDSWYGVDVTLNNSAQNSESYFLRGANIMDKEHITDGVISAANFRFNYPLLAVKDYGATSEEVLTVEIASEDGGTIIYNVSKDGLNSTELSEKGLWISVRYYSLNYENELCWTNWSSIKKLLDSIGMQDGNGYSPTMINSNVMYVQFGITDEAPNDFGTYPEDTEMLATTKYYENEGYSRIYGAPYIKETTPDHNVANLDVTKTYDIEVAYTQNLKKIDESAAVDIKVSTINAGAIKYMEISDVKFNGTNKISFKFTPSAMYQHRDEIYTFTPVNLLGVDSDKVPMSVAYATKNNNVACNRVYPDGRLYVNTYGQPSLVGNGDLSLDGWTDSNGNPVSENQRSQLMLVATRTTEKEGKEMVENTNLPEDAVKASETFEIQLNLCKNIVRIPNGSTVQVAFGFPAGYGPEDEGVTFKVYHFKRGIDGKIDYSKTEEVECVITEYGLMVSVSDFSPFAVVAVDKTQVHDLKKSVYARSVGFGGSFSGKVAQLVGDGQSITYTFLPEEGYKVAKVTLNGNDVQFDGNTVTLGYNNLDDRNVIEFHYVATSVSEYESSSGIAVVYPGAPEALDAPATNPPTSNPPEEGNGNAMNPLIIALIIVSISAFITAAVVWIIVANQKKKKQIE